ncbi:hypothetical protein Tco_0822343 [Tanacetum coccineum]|uniref:Uncharacterized protein n=1 Tax=Tanacetum coccineum TaxID=301880 RepID=A0ABQ5AGK7_9ASTR
MSDKKDEINKKRADKFLSMVEAEKKAKMMVESEKIYRKLMVTGDMVEYVLEKYEKNWKVEDEIVDVILEDLQIKYEKDDKGKGKVKEDLARANQAKQAKPAGDDVDLVDADDVDLFASLDLKNRVKTLEEDFTRLLKAKKAKEAKEAEEAKLKVPKEVIEVSSNEDEDVVCFNDVRYPLTDAEIRMFKNTPTTSRGPTRQLASTSTTSKAPRRQLASSFTRSRAPIAFTSYRGPRFVLALFSPNAPNAPPHFPTQKKKSKP